MQLFVLQITVAVILAVNFAFNDSHIRESFPFP